jgi:hypothetical protein
MMLMWQTEAFLVNTNFTFPELSSKKFQLREKFKIETTSLKAQNQDSADFSVAF